MKKFLIVLSFCLIVLGFAKTSFANNTNYVYLRGTHNNWQMSQNFIMRETYAGSGTYELKHVQLEAGAEFKFDLDEDNEWRENYGENGNVVIGNQFNYAEKNGNNITIQEAGEYDIFFRSSNKTYKIVKTTDVHDGKIKLFYKTGWDLARIHYTLNTNSGSLPNQEQPLQDAEMYPGYKYIEIDAEKLKFEMSYNGNIDNRDDNERNLGGGAATRVIRDYHINFPGTWRLEDGVINKGAPQSSVHSLTLSVDKNEISADNTDTANFTVTIEFYNGTTQVSQTAEIINITNNQSITNRTFKTDIANTYEFVAKLNGLESNNVFVTAKNIERIPTYVVLEADKYTIVADGTDTAIMTGKVYDQFGVHMPEEDSKLIYCCYVPATPAEIHEWWQGANFSSNEPTGSNGWVFSAVYLDAGKNIFLVSNAISIVAE